MKIAIEGCAHGELEKIYDSIQNLEKIENIKIDLLLCCGDFQSTRNKNDLRCMACPVKFQKICTFYKYYSGEKVAPILTIFIGGNHEASNFLQELPYGGWVAPNIYYMGYAGVVNVAGIRIGGISGIYKGHDFLRGHFEKSPYTEDSKRSVYHIRNLEVFRLKQLSNNLDIFLSHDWPRGVYHHGNVDKLLKVKPYFRDEIYENKLGSRPCEDLLYQLKPKYWFAAHLHCKFAAIISHKDKTNDNESEILTTKFLALDKCLPKRQFLQVIEIEHDTTKNIELSYDLEWLTILNLTNHLLSIKNVYYYLPDKNSKHERHNFTPSDEEKNMIMQKFDNNLVIPHNFKQTVEPYDPNTPKMKVSKMPEAQTNEQTDEFCEKLGIDDPIKLLLLTNKHLDTSLNTSLPSYLTPERNSERTFIDSVQLNDSSLSDNSMLTPNKSCSMFIPSSVERSSVRRLNLPPPSNDSKQDESLSDLSSSETSTTLPIVDDCNINGKISIDGDVMSQPPKKFKRRNASMYNQINEDT